MLKQNISHSSKEIDIEILSCSSDNIIFVSCLSIDDAHLSEIISVHVLISRNLEKKYNL